MVRTKTVEATLTNLPRLASQIETIRASLEKQNKALAPKVEIAKLASEVVSLTQATEESVASVAARTSKIEEAHVGFAGLAASIASKVEAADKSVVATQASVSSLASDVEAIQATVAAEMAQAKVAAEAPRPAVRYMIHRAIEAAFADRTGMVDYAIEVAGGQIVRRLTSKTFYHSYSARISGHVVPEQVIRANMKLGHCWPMHGSQGHVAVRLHPDGEVIPTSVTLEHVSKRIAHDIRSAPKGFEVWGYADQQDNTPRLLHQGTYKVEGAESSVQTFHFQNDEAVPIVQLRVLSNHGHPVHTCIYRFRVHGKLAEGVIDEDVLMD